MHMGIIRDTDEDRFHSVRGLVVQIATNPEIDNVSKVLKDFGSGQSVPVYMDEEWWIVYRVDRVGVEEVLSVVSIWDVRGLPHH